MLKLQHQIMLLCGGAYGDRAESTRSFQDTVVSCLPIGALMAGH